jgi:hypothetical protein
VAIREDASAVLFLAKASGALHAHSTGGCVLAVHSMSGLGLLFLFSFRYFIWIWFVIYILLKIKTIKL